MKSGLVFTNNCSKQVILPCTCVKKWQFTRVCMKNNSDLELLRVQGILQGDPMLAVLLQIIELILKQAGKGEMLKIRQGKGLQTTSLVNQVDFCLKFG